MPPRCGRLRPVRSATDKEIVTGAYTFEYSGENKGLDVQGGGQREAGMTAEGASWFAALRGKRRDDGTAVWLNLIEQVAASYHRRYSFIECRHSFLRGRFSAAVCRALSTRRRVLPRGKPEGCKPSPIIGGRLPF